MKTKSIKAALLSTTLLSSATAVFAQSGPFTLNGSVIASGGGTVSGGVYSVTGTIGQPLAGRAITNGVYSLTTGFQAGIYLVQTPGAPRLGIRMGAEKIVVSWPVWFGNYKLQTTMHPEDPSSWTDWRDPVVVLGDQNTVEFRPIDPGPRLAFFRLIRVEP